MNNNDNDFYRTNDGMLKDLKTGNSITIDKEDNDPVGYAKQLLEKTMYKKEFIKKATEYLVSKGIGLEDIEYRVREDIYEMVSEMDGYETIVDLINGKAKINFSYDEECFLFIVIDLIEEEKITDIPSFIHEKLDSLKLNLKK